EIGQRPLERGVAVVVPIDIKPDAQRLLTRASECDRHRVAIHHLSLRVPRKLALFLAQFGSEHGSGFEHFGIGRGRDRDPMGRRTGGGPGAPDRYMRRELLVEGIVARSMHNKEDGRERDNNERAERAHSPSKSTQDASALARGIEENRFADHVRLSRWESALFASGAKCAAGYCRCMLI